MFIFCLIHYVSGAWYKLLIETHKNNNGNHEDTKLDLCVFPLVEKLFQHLMRLVFPAILSFH